jgi:hypothetical protein
MISPLAMVMGCGGPRMAALDDFSDGKVEYETDGRSGDASEGESADFEFGPYTVTGVERNQSEALEGFDDFEPADKRGFTFLLGGGGKTKLRGQCAERAAKETKALDGTVTKVEEEPPLGCTCEEAGSVVTELLVEDLAGEYNGPLTVGGVDARVVGVYVLESGDLRRGRPLGYRVEDNDGTVAGADVGSGESRVWFRKNLEEPSRRQIACALAGLMLWVPPPSPAP